MGKRVKWSSLLPALLNGMNSVGKIWCVFVLLQSWKDISYRTILRVGETVEIVERITTTCFGQKIKQFWENFWRYVQHILGLPMPLTCMSLYLDDPPEGLTRSDKYLLKILTVAAKTAITRKWFQIDIPTVKNWIEMIKEIQEIDLPAKIGKIFVLSQMEKMVGVSAGIGLEVVDVTSHPLIIWPPYEELFTLTTYI